MSLAYILGRAFGRRPAIAAIACACIASVVVAAVYVVITTAYENSARPALAPEQATMQRRVESEAFRLASSAARRLKASLKDPDSLKFRTFLVYRDGTACYEFHAKNSFGANGPGRAVLYAGRLYDAERHGAEFVQAWASARCGRPGATDYAAAWRG